MFTLRGMTPETTCVHIQVYTSMHTRIHRNTHLNTQKKGLIQLHHEPPIKYS